MNFDVLKASTNFSKWRDSEGVVSLGFVVVPSDDEYLEVGEEYILCASRYLRLRKKERESIIATVYITSVPNQFEHVKGEKPICGYAHFFPSSDRDLEFDPARLMFSLYAEPHVFDEMLRANIADSDGATFCLDIEGLEFGWEPDGSHHIWDLKDTSDCELGERRRVTSFSYNAVSFLTTEHAILEVRDKRHRAELEHSPDPDDRKIAAGLQESDEPDPVLKLLSQCRIVLVAILCLGVVALFVAGR